MIADFMTTSFTLQRQSAQANAVGQAVQTWTDYATGKGFIQPASSNEKRLYDTQGIVVTHTLYTETQGILAGDRVLMESKTYLAQGEENYRATGTIPSYSTIHLLELRIG
jgi:SPP1 family predicted phage head-tail adaptor